MENILYKASNEKHKKRRPNNCTALKMNVLRFIGLAFSGRARGLALRWGF